MDLLSAGADVRRYTWDDANHAALALCSSMVSAPNLLLDSAQHQRFVTAIEQQRPQLALQPASVGCYGDDDRAGRGYYTRLLDDDVAEMLLEGPCFTSVPEWLLYYYACIGYNLVEADIDMIQRSPQVRGVHLRVSSYGGQGAGIDGPVAMLGELGKAMPVVAHCAPAYSGGYWLASPAKSIYVDKFEGVGSVGAVQVLYDYSKMNERIGITAHGMTGPNAELKLDGHPDFPITDEMKARFQRDLAKLSNYFQADIARLRSIPVEQIAALNGGTLMGADAVRARLADVEGSSRASLAYLLTLINSQAPATAPRAGVEAPMSGTKSTKILGQVAGANVAEGDMTPAEPTVSAFDAAVQAALPEGAALDIGMRCYHVGEDWFAVVCNMDNDVMTVGEPIAIGPMKDEEAEEAEAKASAKNAAVTAQPSAADAQLAKQIEVIRAELSVTQMSVKELQASNAAAEARAAKAEAALKEAKAEAEAAAWTSALSVVKPEARKSVETLARAEMTAEMTPSAAVEAVLSQEYMSAARLSVGVATKTGDAGETKPKLPSEEQPSTGVKAGHVLPWGNVDKGYQPNQA